MADTRGNIDTVDQTQERLMSGGANAAVLLTTRATPLVIGNMLVVGTDGNMVDSGIAASSVVTGSGGSATPPTPILDSATAQPIMDDAGNWLFPG